MSTSVLTAEGQVTIPEEILQYLHLMPGDRLNVELGAQNAIILRAERSEEARPTRLLGLLSHLAKDQPVTIEEIDKAIAAGVAERFARAQNR